MKRITLLAIIVAVVAASCSNKDGMFTKRKYTKGHYVAHSGKVAKPKVNESKTAIVAEANKMQSVVVKQAVVPATGNVVASAASINNKTSIAVKPVQTNRSAQLTTGATTAKPSIFQKLVNQRAVNKISAPKSSAATDNELIIWVILSFFPILALIAIYLHDGKTITLNFWVDLILHLAFLYWLFALLVVLDIFTLA